MVTPSLEKYLDVLLYGRNIISSSSEIFNYLRKSSAIFGNFQKEFGNDCLSFGQILENLRKSSENCHKSRHVYIINRIVHGYL